MEQELNAINTPEELLEFLETNDILMNLSLEDTGILINYLEGHDYRLACDDAGQLYRIDCCEEEAVPEQTMIDDVIDSCCEWNYELLQDANVSRAECRDFIDFCNRQAKYESLVADERALDKMFDRTIYGKEVEELAVNMANKIIVSYQTSPAVFQAAISELKEGAVGRSR